MMKQIISIYQLYLKKLLDLNQNGICKFISLLVCICTDRTMLSLGLIYQADLYNLQDSWLEDFDSSSEEVYFTVFKKK